jgi:WG containing repeat
VSIAWGMFLTLLLWPAAARAQGRDQSVDLLPVEKNGIYGYLSHSGGEAITPRFDLATRFSEGLAAVQVDDNWGYIDSTGATKVQPHFASASSFSDGLAVVSLDQSGGTRYFYIDRTGRIMTEGYDKAEPFAQGFAAVTQSGRSFFIDASGKRAFGREAQFDSAESFSDGLALVSSSGHYGYIDRTGKLVISAQFKAARSFSGGLAAVQAADGLWGYIDHGGTIRIKPQFKAAKNFSEGLAPVQQPADPGKKVFGFVDPTGTFVIAPRFENARSFSEGLAAVAIHDPYAPELSAGSGPAADPTRWAFINHQGELVTPPHFLVVDDFHRGTAYVIAAVTMRAYYIDDKGVVVASASDIPAFASMGVNEDVLVSLYLESTPAGATVFMIPLFEWENDQNLPNEESKLSMYKVADGVTPVVIKVPRETYEIVFKLDQKTEVVRKPIIPGERNVANVRIQ